MGTHGDEKCIQVVARKPQGERPLWRPTRIWEENITYESYRNMVGGYGLDSSGTEQGEVVGSCIYDNETLDSMKPWNSWTLQNPAAFFFQILFTTMYEHA